MINKKIILENRNPIRVGKPKPKKGEDKIIASGKADRREKK